MGGKQSKRSVDISGKEAEGESAVEVAAAGAGGEGRVERLADDDSLKPQLNGDAHIQPPDERTDKEKQLDSGTPENEKDATTEKEAKDQENEKEKDTAPVTNGDSEQKIENGETTPTTEEGKKPKKEKVKKKWSLRSISFSRKDKPKQEKKQKEEETKTNGEPEKVPEEAAEATAETVQNKEDNKSESETKNEKTPETPVTEPITNGSSTPETPKVETPVSEEPAPIAAVAASSEDATTENKTATEPEQLPVNGLSLEEHKEEANVAQIEETKPEVPTTEVTVTVPAPEIPVKTEVCVEQVPLIESMPPPLPANPPPSSVVTFAATTMAPEMSDALLVNTADTATSTLIPDAPIKETNDVLIKSQTTLASTEPSVQKDTDEGTSQKIVNEPAVENATETTIEVKTNDDNHVPIVAMEELNSQSEIGVVKENVINETFEIKEHDAVSEHIIPQQKSTDIIPCDISNNGTVEPPTEKDSHFEIAEDNASETNIENIVGVCDPAQNLLAVKDEIPAKDGMIGENFKEEITNNSDIINDLQGTEEDLPLPPPPIEDDIIQSEISEENVGITLESQLDTILECKETIVNSDNVLENTDSNRILNMNGSVDIEEENLKNETGNNLPEAVEEIECNGSVTNVGKVLVNGAAADDTEDTEAKVTSEGSEESMVLVGATEPAARAREELAPAQPQDPLPVSDKLADLIPEIPLVPDLKTETEMTTEVAVPN